MSEELKEVENRILTALSFKGIDVVRGTYITTHETVIAKGDSLGELDTKGIGENISWRDFIHEELSTLISHKRAEAVREFGRHLRLKALKGDFIDDDEPDFAMMIEEYLSTQPTVKEEVK